MKQKGKDRRRLKKPVRIGMVIMAMVMALFVGVGIVSRNTLTAYAEPDTVVDPDTTNNWSSIAASSNSTENIGRIWTDKSVFNEDYKFEGTLQGQSVSKGNSDFLVALSALSSTSNLKSTVTNTTPLDIVLVLDVSGSMDGPIGEIETTTYQEVYDGRNWGLNTRTTYYVRRGNDYIAVNWSGGYYGSWRDREGNEYEPRTSSYDSNRNHVQFYQQITASESAGSKIEALKDAANGFAETFATMNDGITDTNKQHRISVVKFSGNGSNQIGNDTYSYDRNTYNYSQVVSDLRSYTTQTVSDLERTINSLDPAGSTRADYGLSQAERVLNGDGSLTGAREGAQKVVIFFTDGEPNGFSGWDGTVAANAINNAYDMKQSGTLVYTIGVFEDANPSDTSSNFNRYMNAVSSNYPEAECADRRGQQTNDFSDLDLGDKVQGEDGEEAPQYYYSATNSVGLEQVFKDITESLPINQGSGSPIEEVEGAAGTPGYLTFTDTLGSFMEVTGVGADNNKMYLAFADGLHEGTTSDGGKTWKFSGVVNEGNGVNTAYPEGANLSEIKVTVTKSNDLATGDTITVQIPASLIPMRNYDVDTDNGTMTVSNTFPVRLFYGASVKDGAIDALNDPQNENHDAVLAQTSTDGKTVDFYSNSFVKDAAEGSTEASFTPSVGNKFYYYPVNTQLFIDEDCMQPATRSNIGDYSTLYYKDSYWRLTGEEGNAAEEVPANGSITRSGNDWNVSYHQDGNAYIAANTPRADRPATLVSDKDKNETGTASTVLTPTWNGSDVSQKLGNNGKLSVPAPGDLRIEKTVNWGNASLETQTNKNSFKFTVHLYTVAEDGTQTSLTNQYNYAIYATGEDPIDGGTGTISGNGEIILSAGQYVVISDLPNGAHYTVTEQDAGLNGFTTTDNSTGENAKTDDGVVEGTIVGGGQQTASFTNTYHATEVDLNGANQLIKVQKNLTGREWQDTDEFRFTMLAEGNAPAPESTDAVVVDDEDATTNYTVNLSNITFENPYTYTYVIEEDNDTNPIAGIDYSNETYAVTITVVDDGEGALQIDSVQFEQRADVDGNKPAGQPQITDNTVVFTNNYDATEATTNLNGTKYYTDNSGTNPNTANKFTFELKAIGGYATEGGSIDNPTIDAANVPMPEGADANTHTITIGNNGTNPDDGFAFQTIKYDGTHLYNTYIYEIREVIPQGATDNGNGTWSLNGMTYEGTVHTVTVAVTDEPNTQGEGVHIVATPSMQPAEVKFTNVYDPEDYKLTGGEAIHGTKVLQGREIGDNETFYFQLTQTDGPETVLAAPETKTVTKNSGMDFVFSDLTFSNAGTYTFTVNEVADDQGTETTDDNGMTYSQNVAKVTIKVKDGGNGALVLDGPVVYENQGSNETGKAVFTNVYKAEMKYGAEGKGGIIVTKQLLDRPMTAGEFTFTITGVGDAADLTAEADKSFQNTAAAADETIYMAKLQSLTFDETDAGKAYTFIVDEAEPAEGQALAGVTYDKSQYKVEIEVVDNGNGTMHAVTTVTQVKDANGDEIANGGKVVFDHVNTDAEDYTVPSFGFTNDYNPTPVVTSDDAKTTLQVTKTVIGAPSPDGVEYNFTLTPDSNNPAEVTGTQGAFSAHTDGVINADGESDTEDDSQTVSFGQLTFSKPGTYTFTVQESEPTADDGWTFDTTPKTITVTVDDQNPGTHEYDGKLYITNISGNPAKVTNSYEAKSVIVGGEGAAQQITVKKTVTGHATTDEQYFTFTIDATNADEWAEGAVTLPEGSTFDEQIAVTDVMQAGESKTVSFGALQFNAEGTYKFTITENEGTDETADPSGWTYDAHTVYVTVTVTDENKDGQLDASVSYDQGEATTDADKAETGAAAFTNKYTATPAELTKDTKTGIGVKKQVTGAPNSDDFTFSATFNANAEGCTGSADNIEGLIDGKLTAAISDDFNTGDEKAADFGTVKFTAPGVYVFDVTEDNASTAAPNGWKYDDSTQQIKVTVTDNNVGALVASVEGNDPLFTNAYAPGSVVLDGDSQLKVTKVVTGAPALSDFEFTLELTEGDATGVEGLDANNSITKSTTGFTGLEGDAANQTVEFGALTFTKTGTYTFKVVENTTTNANGWNYQSGIDNAKTITVTVTDQGFDGQLDATTMVNDVDSNNPTFTNSYKAGSITTGEGGLAKLQVTKTVEGAPATEEFKFELTPAENYGDWVSGLNEEGKLTVSTSGMTGTTEPQTLTFGDLTFNAEGTYVFNVNETNADPAEGSGWTYDNDSAKQITIVVSDPEKDGKLNATTVVGEVETNNPEFVNSYTAAPVTGVPVKFNFTKQFTGHAWTSDYSFTFTMEAIDGAPMPTDAVNGVKTITVNGPTDETGTIAALNFGDITYDTTGDYKYKITEVVLENPNAGIKYDTTPRYVTVTVTDLDGAGNHTGHLSASVTKVSDSTTFTNTYESGTVDYDATVGLAIHKNLTGHDIIGDQFGFTLTATNDAAKNFLGGDTKVVYTSGSELENGVASEIVPVETGFEFTKDNTGEYTFDVSETKGGDSEHGYTNDTNVYHVRIESIDSGNGTLTVNTYVSDEGGVHEGEVLVNTVTSSAANRSVSNVVLTFNNSYTGEGTLGGEGNVNILASKELANRDLAEGEFTFNVVNAKDPNETVIASGTNAADGTITFAPIQYSTDSMLADVRNGLAEPGSTKDEDGTVHRTFTYQYKVSETGTLPDGVTLDDTTANAGVFDIKVILTDNNDGTYAVEVVYPDGKDGLVFSNTYGRDASVTLKLNGEKIYKTVGTDKAPDITGKYTFNLTSEEGTPMPESVETVNDRAGNVDFGDVTYTMENVFGTETDTEGGLVTAAEGQPVRSKTFTYNVTETGQIAGVTNDPETTKSFTVTVYDMGDGTITVDPSSESTDMRFSFTNTYSVESITTNPITAGLTITKNLTGRTLNDGEFTFQMTNLATKEVYEGKNKADGSITFPDITFTETGMTEFEIKEVNNGLGGIGYDNNIFKVTATVTDNQDGTLSVEWKSDSDIIFNNNYTADPASMTIGAVKVLSGRELTENEFTFRLSDADGNVIEEVKNDANGGVIFSELKYDKAGEYVYTVSEVKGDDEDITYDESVYTITVNVTDDLVGQLHAETSITKGEETVDSIVFNNIYTEPEKPEEPEGPSTGVWTNPAPFAVTFSASLAAILAILYRRLH